MADNDDTEEEGGKKKGGAPRRTAEPVVKDASLHEWLVKVFWEDEQYPERLDIRPVSGRFLEKLAPMLKQVVYASPAAGDTARKSGAGRKKPSKEEIVHFSNEIVGMCQRHCDMTRRQTTYGVHAAHYSRETDYYERWVGTFTPQGIYSKKGEGVGGDEDDEEEGGSTQKRYATQALAHDERMFDLLARTIEAVVDRQDRIIERQEGALENLRARYEKQQEITEKALSFEADREAAREWRRLGIAATGKTIDLGLQLAPPILNRVFGESTVPTTETAETITLKNFFKTAEEGGLLTDAQAAAAFGVYGPAPDHKFVKAGVLSLEQSQLLYGVAHGKVPPDALDELLPGGRLAVSMEQFMRLQAECGFSMAQLAPLRLLFEGRMTRKQKQVAQ